MKIIPFAEKYRQDFIDINTDWIVSNFGALEEHDVESFQSIDEQLQTGAMIFFAVENDTVLAPAWRHRRREQHGKYAN